MTNKLTLPDGWHEVKIGQYQEIVSIETTDTTRRWVEIIAILSNEDPEKVKLMDLPNFTKAITHLSFITTLPDEKMFKEELNINGVTYTFQERLQDLTNGEWIDIESYIENSNHNLHKIFAILYSDGSEYTGKSLDSRAKLFQDNMNIQDCYGALLFFSLIGKESIMTIKDYLTSEIQKQNSQAAKMMMN